MFQGPFKLKKNPSGTRNEKHVGPNLFLFAYNLFYFLYFYICPPPFHKSADSEQRVELKALRTAPVGNVCLTMAVR